MHDEHFNSVFFEQTGQSIEFFQRRRLHGRRRFPRLLKRIVDGRLCVVMKGRWAHHQYMGCTLRFHGVVLLFKNDLYTKAYSYNGNLPWP